MKILLICLFVIGAVGFMALAKKLIDRVKEQDEKNLRRQKNFERGE